MIGAGIAQGSAGVSGVLMLMDTPARAPIPSVVRAGGVAVIGWVGVRGRGIAVVRRVGVGGSGIAVVRRVGVGGSGIAVVGGVVAIVIRRIAIALTVTHIFLL